MIKLIVSDVDGTLLQNGEIKISDSVVERINMLQDQGVTFAVASGRQYPNLKRLFKNVNNDIIYICENGALIVYKSKILSKTPINRMLGLEIIQDIWNRDGCEILLSGMNTSYLAPKKISYFEYIRNHIGNNCTLIEDINAVEEELLKISVYNEEGIDLHSDYFIHKWSERVKTAVSGKYWLDFTNRYVNKGNGIKIAKKMLNITTEDTMAFGDNYNDLEMFDQAYFSYAMQHADVKVRQAARYITPNVESILTDVLRMR